MTSTAARPGPSTIRLGGLDIAYDEQVLEPRPWTAAQSEWAGTLLEDAAPGPVLELCTGAGHIGLLAIFGNDRRLVAVDANPVACEFARRNAVAAGLADRVEVRAARIDTALAPEERFPVIIADPPWVPSDRTTTYPEDPLLAIDGGDDGLVVARLCLEVAAAHLLPDGVMLLQLGSLGQARSLEDAAASYRLMISEVRQPAPNGVVACVRRAR
ncbi:MAG: methyltransferase, partial [Ilumatobacteraceae bacterium]